MIQKKYCYATEMNNRQSEVTVVLARFHPGFYPKPNDAMGFNTSSGVCLQNNNIIMIIILLIFGKKISRHFKFCLRHTDSRLFLAIYSLVPSND